MIDQQQPKNERYVNLEVENIYYFRVTGSMHLKVDGLGFDAVW